MLYFFVERVESTCFRSFSMQQKQAGNKGFFSSSVRCVPVLLGALSMLLGVSLLVVLLLLFRNMVKVVPTVSIC